MAWHKCVFCSYTWNADCECGGDSVETAEPIESNCLYHGGTPDKYLEYIKKREEKKAIASGQLQKRILCDELDGEFHVLRIKTKYNPVVFYVASGFLKSEEKAEQFKAQIIEDEKKLKKIRAIFRSHVLLADSETPLADEIYEVIQDIPMTDEEAKEILKN